MVPDRHRQAQQGLQQAVNVGGGKQVRAARHQRHAVGGIVQRRGQMIAGRRLLAQDHHIPEQIGTRDLPPGKGIVRWSDLFQSLAAKGYDGYLSYEAPNPAHWARDAADVAGEGVEATRHALGRAFV